MLWLENGTRPGGGGRRGVIWRADPRDIANRWEVVSFDRDEIHAAVVSPDERLIALTAGAYSLWVCNLDGSDLRQVVPDAWQILWSQNNRAIFYEIDEQGSNQTGVEWVNLANGEIQRVLTLEQPVFLHLLGWSPGGQWLYYIRSSPQSYQGYELWKMRQDGSDSQVIVSLGATLPELSQVILSPDGSKLVVGAYERLSWVSTNGQKKEDLPVPPPGRGFQVQWAPGRNDEVIVGQYDERQPLYHLYAISIPTYSARELATFGIPAGPGWDRLALSPDHHWLMAHLYQIGYYWIHLPTGTMIPILCQDCSVQFVAWVSREPGP